MAGGYTPFKPLDWRDQQVFSKAFEGLLGVSYTPCAVSTQVVNGINYRFLCTKTLVTQDPITTIVIVNIHCSLDGEVTRKSDTELAAK